MSVGGRQWGLWLFEPFGLLWYFLVLDAGRSPKIFFVMARYEHLPIYKAALDLTVHLEKLVAGFSRYHKYTLGTEMREGSRALLMQILKANDAPNAKQRCTELLVLRNMVEALLMTLRVAKEVKAFQSFQGYLFVIEQVGSVARQNEGWLTHTSQAKA